MFGIVWTTDLLLLTIPSIALTGFMLLGLDPLRLRAFEIRVLAILGGVGPLIPMLVFATECFHGSCIGAVPIFTLVVGESTVALALQLDPLSALVGLTVSIIGAAVILYSVAYMAGTALGDLRRFFALMHLFLAAMLTMVLAGDSIVLFLGWEMMGLCSYLLIAYNTTSAQAIRAGRKAFIMTRFADAMLLAALLLLFLEANSVRLDALIPAGVAAQDGMRPIIAALLLGGAIGKSAQLPLHTWLPSAMAGPTPVSALLHSATMVAAGAVLLIRFAPILAAEPLLQALTAILGAATALFGAASALVQQDVKRLLAYSSISQIGTMMLSIGVGAPQAAAAHFVVHAIFKSLLFLAAGDIAHHSPQGTALAALRGARQRKPLAFLAFLAGAASLAGLPVITAGWWSKEAMLAAVWSAGPILWVVALATAVLTAAYATRAALVAAQPAPAAEAAQDDSSDTGYTLFPLAFLGFGALLAGGLVNPIIRFLGGDMPHAPAFTLAVAAIAPIAGAVLALALAPGAADTPMPAARTGGRRASVVDRVLRVLVIQPFVRLVRWVNGQDGGVEDPVGTGPARLVVWLRRTLAGPTAPDRADRLYKRAFVLPFLQLVRRLNGYGSGVVDPLGNLPARAVLRLQRALADALAPDWIDRWWRRIGAALLSIWTSARRLQTGRVRDHGLAMVAGTAGLLLLAWGYSWH
ncbi:oxidoreductase [Rhodobacter sp. Har01]|uniref:NADH-quinone oxidoreductase subunit 5 family protein n=1 Tax=Rhodobacter sp. Har01 TaxID=2883999 RepID=UPI001D05CE04|nr:proton-conducting transporter membrane subunit [Rhodobacter sp. Har01]MCB6179929.1 oxidoreductase [Rhodobacter sp. Har01]